MHEHDQLSYMHTLHLKPRKTDELIYSCWRRLRQCPGKAQSLVLMHTAKVSSVPIGSWQSLCLSCKLSEERSFVCHVHLHIYI